LIALARENVSAKIIRTSLCAWTLQLYFVCFVLFTVYVFTVAYVGLTVLLPVGVIKDDDGDDDDDSVPSQCRFRGDIV